MENFLSIANVVLLVITVFGLISLLAERGTEIVKILLELFTGMLFKLPKLNSFIQHPVMKWILSFFVAWAASKGIPSDVFAGLPFDSEFVQVLVPMLTWLISNYLHLKLKPVLPGADSLRVRKYG